MDGIDEFYRDSKHSEEAEVVTTKKAKKTKKRKPDSDGAEPAAEQKETEEDTLRKKARFYTKSPEQWKVVSRYAPKRLEEFVQEKEFETKKEFQTSIMDGFHQIMASGIDKITGGEGHVREHILADVSLRKALEEEGADFVQYFNNKIKIAVLSVLDIANGKRRQFASRPCRQSEESGGARIEEEPINDSDQGRNQEEEEGEIRGTEGPDLS